MILKWLTFHKHWFGLDKAWAKPLHLISQVLYLHSWKLLPVMMDALLWMVRMRTMSFFQSEFLHLLWYHWFKSGLKFEYDNIQLIKSIQERKMKVTRLSLLMFVVLVPRSGSFCMQWFVECHLSHGLMNFFVEIGLQLGIVRRKGTSMHLLVWALQNYGGLNLLCT